MNLLQRGGSRQAVGSRAPPLGQCERGVWAGPAPQVQVRRAADQDTRQPRGFPAQGEAASAAARRRRRLATATTRPRALAHLPEADARESSFPRGPSRYW